MALQRLALLSLALAAACARNPRPAAPPYTIVDDPALTQAVAETRGRFLAMVDYDRFDVCVLLPDPASGGRVWRRGSFGGDALAYPASCVKLPYLVAAMHFAREHGLPADWLDEHVRPMIVVSSNESTGSVVDAITGAPNLASAEIDSREFRRWLHARRYTERFLAQHGLRGAQTIFNKTYPSNSGESPQGAEELARVNFGRNMMCPDLSAALMLAIRHGGLEAWAQPYMRSLLRRPRWDSGAFLANGLPPGTINENKPGAAYDTVEDIAWLLFPDGGEMVIAVYTNGLGKNGRLGTFTSLLIERLGLDANFPPRARVSPGNPGFATHGEWTPGPDAPDRFGPLPRTARGGRGEATATWDLAVPEDGVYEVCVWFPRGESHATDAPFFVESAEGRTGPIEINQRVRGARWVRLGDFRFGAGGGRVTLTNDVSAESSVVADTVEARRWPDPRP